MSVALSTRTVMLRLDSSVRVCMCLTVCAPMCNHEWCRGPLKHSCSWRGRVKRHKRKCSSAI
jgi:hypothetical protein